MSETLERLRARTPEMVELLGALVTSESPSGDAVALTTTATLLARCGTELLGQEPEWLATGDSAVLSWRLPAQHGGHGRPILLLAHLDTVWPLGTTTPSGSAAAYRRPS